MIKKALDSLFVGYILLPKTGAAIIVGILLVFIFGYLTYEVVPLSIGTAMLIIGILGFFYSEFRPVPIINTKEQDQDEADKIHKEG